MKITITYSDFLLFEYSCMRENIERLLDNIMDEAKSGYPSIRRSITIGSILRYIGETNICMFNPSRLPTFSDKKINSVYVKLKKINIDKYVIWLVKKPKKPM